MDASYLTDWRCSRGSSERCSLGSRIGCSGASGALVFASEAELSGPRRLPGAAAQPGSSANTRGGRPARGAMLLIRVATFEPDGTWLNFDHCTDDAGFGLLASDGDGLWQYGF